VPTSNDSVQVFASCRLVGDRAVIRYDELFWSAWRDPATGKTINKYKQWCYRNGHRMHDREFGINMVMDIGPIDQLAGV
jgi:hypothetical protein